MGRPAKEEKDRRRARIEVESALARSRLLEGAQALLRLPPQDRPWALPSLSAPLLGLLERAHSARDTETVLAWLSCVEREPRLVPGGEAASAARWLFFVAALRSRQWPRARRLLEELAPALLGSASWERLVAYVASEGCPDPTLFVNSGDEDLARLGYDAPRARATYACPKSLAEVEEALLACFVSEPWTVFRDTVLGWLAQAPRDVALALRCVTASLVKGELARSAAQGGRVAIEQARLCAGFADEAGAPPELEDAVLLALRVLLRALPSTLKERWHVEALGTVTAAALRYPGLAALVEPVVLALRYDDGVLASAERVVRALLTARPNAETLLLAARLVAEQGKGGELPTGRAPEWLQRATEQALNEPQALIRVLSGDGRRAGALLLTVLPVPLATRVVEDLWEQADESGHVFLAAAAESLARRLTQGATKGQSKGVLARVRRAMAEIDPILARRASDAELRRLLDSELGPMLRLSLDDDDCVQPVPAALLPEWNRLAQRAVPYQVGMLDAILHQCPGGACQCEAAVSRFLDRRDTVVARVEAVAEAASRGLLAALERLEARLLEGLSPAPLDAARGLLCADRCGAPRSLLQELAKALQRALEAHPQTTPVDEIEAASRLATLLLPVRRKKAGSPTKKKAASPTKKAKPKKAAAKGPRAEPAAEPAKKARGKRATSSAATEPTPSQEAKEPGKPRPKRRRRVSGQLELPVENEEIPF